MVVGMACVTCELVERRDAGEAPPWDRILRTDYWDVVHGFGTSVEGWMVLVLRRHLEAVADLTDDEAIEMGLLATRLSRAMGEALGCPKTYIVQFAEAAEHPHVHVHVIPRYADQPDEYKGPGIFFHALGVSSADEVPQARRNEIGAELSRLLVPPR